MMDVNDMMARARESERVSDLQAERDRLARELEEAQAEVVKLLDECQKLRARNWKQVCESDWFHNLAYYGEARRVLQLLQDGAISRVKAAEALVELAHGVTPLLPDQWLLAFAEDEIPSEVVVSLRRDLEEMKDKANNLFTENERLKANLHDAVRRGGQQAKRAIVARAELARMRPVVEAVGEYFDSGMKTVGKLLHIHNAFYAEGRNGGGTL